MRDPTANTAIRRIMQDEARARRTAAPPPAPPTPTPAAEADDTAQQAAQRLLRRFVGEKGPTS